MNFFEIFKTFDIREKKQIRAEIIKLCDIKYDTFYSWLAAQKVPKYAQVKISQRLKKSPDILFPKEIEKKIETNRNSKIAEKANKNFAELYCKLSAYNKYVIQDKIYKYRGKTILETAGLIKNFLNFKTAIPTELQHELYAELESFLIPVTAFKKLFSATHTARINTNRKEQKFTGKTEFYKIWYMSKDKWAFENYIYENHYPDLTVIQVANKIDNLMRGLVQLNPILREKLMKRQTLKRPVTERSRSIDL